MVTHVTPGTPAARAGMRPNDLIQKIGATDVSSVEQSHKNLFSQQLFQHGGVVTPNWLQPRRSVDTPLFRWLEQYQPGAKVVFGLRRGDEHLDVTVETISRRVHVFNATTGKEQLQPIDAFECIWGPEGRYLLAGVSKSGTSVVRVLDAATGQLHFQCHHRYSTPPALHPNGKRLLVCGDDLEEWELNTGQRVHKVVSGADRRFEAATYDAGGHAILAVERNRNVIVLDAKTGRELAQRRFLDRIPAAPVIDPAGNSVAICAGNLVYVMDRDKLFAGGGKALASGYEGVQHMQPSPDGNWLAVLIKNGPLAGQLVVVDTQTGKVMHRIEVPDGRRTGCCFAFDDEGRRLAIATNGEDAHKLTVWTMRELSIAFEKKSLAGNVLDLAFQGNAVRSLVLQDNDIAVYEPLTGQKLMQATLARAIRYPSPLFSVFRRVQLLRRASGRLLPNDQVAFRAPLPDRLEVWDLRTGKRRLEYPDVEGVSGNWVSPQGTYMVAPFGGRLRLIRLADGEPVDWAQGIFSFSLAPTVGGRGARFKWSPDERRLLVLDRLGNATVWDVPTGRELLSLDEDHHVIEAAFGPRGNVVLAVENGDLHVIAGAKLQFDPPQHPIALTTLAWELAAADASTAEGAKRLVAIVDRAHQLDAEPREAARFVAGAAQYRAGNYRHALELLAGPSGGLGDRFENRKPWITMTVAFRAMAHWKLGEKQAAFEQFERVRNNQSTDQNLRQILGEASRMLGVPLESPATNAASRHGQSGRSPGNRPVDDEVYIGRFALRLLDAWDLNGDATLTRTEAPARLWNDGKADTNGDGLLDEEEILHRVRQNQMPFQNVPQSLNASHILDNVFPRMDRDSNGKVARDEASPRFWTGFGRFDANRDGSLELDELQQGFEQTQQESGNE